MKPWSACLLAHQIGQEKLRWRLEQEHDKIYANMYFLQASNPIILREW
jgi:hypothetical protein